MTETAIGRFDIEMKPEASFGDGIGRFSLTKQFHGDLEGDSVGEMLAVRTHAPGSAGYVLLEQVRGVLKGRSGAFILQHSGIMDRSKPELSVKVVPDSGTGHLEGLAGEMTIDAANHHAYVFTYSLPEAG